MKHENFCYWLQGFAELAGEKPTKEQWRMIMDHLDLALDDYLVPAIPPHFKLKTTEVCETNISEGNTNPRFC